MVESEKINRLSGNVATSWFRTICRRPPLNTAGQTRETIAFTQREYAAGRMSGAEKLRLDNMSIRNNSLSQLNGTETFADEEPDEWKKYESNSV